MEIYLLIDDKPQGPYSSEVVRQYLKAGRFKPTDLAAYAGQADWKPLSVITKSWAQDSPGVSTRSAAFENSSKPKPAALIAGVVLVILVVAAVFAFLKFHARSNWTSMKVVTRAERDWPNSYSELNEWYVEPPEGKNAATYYLKGLYALQITDSDSKSADLPVLGQASLPPPGTQLSAQNRAAIATVLQRNDRIWAALDEGMNFEQARYPIDLNLGPETLLPHLFKIKRTVQLAELKAEVSADDNQTQTAADTILESLAVAQSLRDEPVMISQLVRAACFAIETSTLQYVMNSAALSSADLERLAKAFAKVESTEIAGQGFTRAYVGERASSFSLFDTPPEQLLALLKKEGFDTGLLLRQGSNVVQNLQAQRDFAEETFNHALAMRREPFPQRLEVDEYFTSRAGLSAKNKIYLCQMLLPGLEKAGKREAAGLGNLRLAQTAIALEQYMQANAGSYPNSLSALTSKFLPKVPADPFNGRSIHYQRTGDGYELNCTGQDPAKPLSFKVVKALKPVVL